MEREPSKDPEQLEEELEDYVDLEGEQPEPSPVAASREDEEEEEGPKPIDELELGENIESTKEIRAREAIKAEKSHLYQVGPEAEGLVEDDPTEARMDEPLEGAGIGEDFKPTHPARDLDTGDLNAAAAAGADIVREEMAEMEEEDEEDE